MVFVPVIIVLGLLIAAGVFRLGSKNWGASKIYFVMLPIPLLLLFVPFFQPLGVGVGAYLFFAGRRLSEQSNATGHQHSILRLSIVVAAAPVVIFLGYFVFRVYNTWALNQR
jgi:hypothetical protein